MLKGGGGGSSQQVRLSRASNFVVYHDMVQEEEMLAYM